MPFAFHEEINWKMGKGQLLKLRVHHQNILINLLHKFHDSPCLYYLVMTMG